MTNTELSEVIRNADMYEIACKTVHDIALDDTEKEVVASLDEHFRNVGKTGRDAEGEISAFIQRVVNEEMYNTPEEILDTIFDRGTIGEFDSYEGVVTSKNGLIAYEAAKGGSVERSFIDPTIIAPKFVNLQIDSEITYKDLAKNGWKTVAKITEYAVQALKNKQFAIILGDIDDGITMGADNYIAAGGAAVTAAAADALAVYVNDRAEIGDGLIMGKSAYIQQMSKLTGFASDGMKDEVNRYGYLGRYDGIPMRPISSAKKMGDGSAIVPDLRVFGFAGKVGELNMQGEVKVYQDSNNSKEVVNIHIKDFTFGYAFYKTAFEDIAKIVLT